MRQDINWEHPIDEQYVIPPYHRDITECDVHRWLEQIAAFTTELRVQHASLSDELAEGDGTVGTHTRMEWMDHIFPRLGLTVDSDRHSSNFVEEARYALMNAHQRHGINELDMDYNRPLGILVAAADSRPAECD